MKNSLFAGLLILLSLSVFPQDPWMEGDGNGSIELRFRSLQYDRLLDGFNNPDIGLKREVTHSTLEAYVEYGISEKLDVHLSVPFKMLATSEALLNPQNDNYPLDTVESGSLNTFSNISAGAKYLIATGTFTIAGKIMVGANTAQYDSATGLRSGYDAWLITPSISIGRKSDLFYFFTEAGFRIKTNSYSNDLLIKVEGGYRILWQENFTTWVVPFIDADLRTSVGYYQDNRSLHTGLYVDGEGFISPGLKVRQQLAESLLIDLGMSYPVWGEDHGKAITLFVGAAWNW